MLRFFLPTLLALLFSAPIQGQDESAAVPIPDLGAQTDEPSGSDSGDAGLERPQPKKPKQKRIYRKANTPNYSPFRVDLPLIDSPFNNTAASWPSMDQAVAYSRAAYQTLHYSTGHILNPYYEGALGYVNALGYLGIDVLFSYLPLGESWVHEEFHRAVMGVRGTSSYDGVYDIPIGAGSISVYKVKDEDLIRLKRDHPADMVRLPAAGVEGQTLLVQALEKDAFFDHVDNWHGIQYLLSYSNTWAYITSGSTNEANTLTDEMNEKEPTIAARDFVGHDFTSWVYDLHRPDEPYENRGTHPSGTGINRYRKESDLSLGERRFLKLQGKLNLINFLDPLLFGVNRFQAGENWQWNLNGQHYLTSFGYSLQMNLFLKNEATNLLVSPMLQRNQKLSTPGLALELVRWPVPHFIPHVPRFLSLKAMVWKQAENQRYDDSAAAIGGLVDLTFWWPLSGRTEFFAGASAKSPGWVAGNPYLDRNASARSGISMQMF